MPANLCFLNTLNCLAWCLLMAGCADAPLRLTKPSWALQPVSKYESGYQKGTEIISVQQASLKAILTNSKTGEIDVLDISRPEAIKRLARFNLGLRSGQELTSAAFHPRLPILAAVIDNGFDTGALQIRSALTGSLLQTLEVGNAPDAVIFSSDGSLVVIANEGEDFKFDPATRKFSSPEGSISVVDFDPLGRVTAHTLLNLPDLTELKGFSMGYFRYLARPVDWNGDGKIEEMMDFNGDGKITDSQSVLGHFHSEKVVGVERRGEKEILIPIKRLTPDSLEPEFIAITPDNLKAYVTLQENNVVAVVDLQQKSLVDYFDLGISRHAADLKHDGRVDFSDQLLALREPDGIVMAGDNGKYFITADEGDSEIVNLYGKVNKTTPRSGGRTVSVFDAASGKLLGDTGNQLDTAARDQDAYNDKRSDNRGSEPEMLAAFAVNGTPLVAVNLDEAGVVELISLAEPAQPQVLALGRFPGKEKKGPEGIAHFQINNEHYLLTANEKNGTVECFKVITGRE